MHNDVVNDVPYAGLVMRGDILGLERRRRWCDDEKLEIVLSVGVGGVTVKSTLLKGIVGALRPREGRITLGRARIAYLPQQAEIDRSFPISVRDLMAMGLWAESGAFGLVGPSQGDRIATAMAAVGLMRRCLTAD